MDTDPIVTELPPIEAFSSAYSGKLGCACGCNGKYYYAEACRVASGEARGYIVKDEDVSDRDIKRIYNAMTKALASNMVTAMNNRGVEFMKGPNRVYRLYFTRK